MEITKENYEQLKSKKLKRLEIAAIYNILSILGSVSKKGKVSTLKYSTNSSKILLKFMYENSLVSLPRKYSLYQSIIIDNNRKTKRGELESLKI